MARLLVRELPSLLRPLRDKTEVLDGIAGGKVELLKLGGPGSRPLARTIGLAIEFDLPAPSRLSRRAALRRVFYRENGDLHCAGVLLSKISLRGVGPAHIGPLRTPTFLAPATLLGK